MAVGVPSESVRALSDALGLKWCREATIRLAVGDAVTVNTHCYATDQQLNALTDQIVSRRMVLVDADEYARLKELERSDTHAMLVQFMKRGAVSVNEAGEASGLPPIGGPEASA